MNGFDFGQIGEVVSNVMDTDYIDIKRDVDSSLVEVYSNILCHVAYVSIENPDAKTVDIKPIIQGITIHLPLWVDIRNNDFIIAKKIGSNGSIIGVYSGRCGNPVVSMGRKKVLMNMDATEPEQPTPVPPSEYNTVVVRYVNNYGEQIKEPSVVMVEPKDNFTMDAPSIEGFNATSHIVDGVSAIGTSVTIADVEESHEVSFVYVAKESEDEFRFLVNGLYTKDDGTLANGWHTYKGVPIDSISYEDETYTITSDNVEFEHRDNGKILEIKAGALMVLFPNELFVTVKTVSVSSGKATFTAKAFTPTEAQSNYYKTRWYD